MARGPWLWPGDCGEADEAIQARDGGSLCLVSSSAVKRNEGFQKYEEGRSLNLQ